MIDNRVRASEVSRLMAVGALKRRLHTGHRSLISARQSRLVGVKIATAVTGEAKKRPVEDMPLTRLEFRALDPVFF